MPAAAPPPATWDAVVVGAGPNGLTAALTLARAGRRVLVVEASERIGGGCRSAELTLPGFLHDVCAAAHPMAQLSPAFDALGLNHLGVVWRDAPFALAHPLPDGSAPVLQRSIAAAAQSVGPDQAAWRDLFSPLADPDLIRSLLQPVWRLSGGALGARLRFGLVGLRSAQSLAMSRFAGPAARALFAGCAAHSLLALDRAGTASFGLMLALTGHLAGWPIAAGGSQSIVDALAAELRRCGGEIEVQRPVRSLAELPSARAILFDLSPRQVAAICGSALPSSYRRRLERFPQGPGVFKVDWALSEPIPWRNAECRRAATVHVGGSFEEILRSEAAMASGAVSGAPFVLVVQPSLFDPGRAPAGRHTGWAYCHVPNGCPLDLTAVIEAQVERFAPGFRDTILARHSRSPAALEQYNAAMTGGDIGGGSNDLRHFLFRPVPRWNPYRTPNPRIFLCSSSTPPGAGVHGMCGYLAAQAALKKHRNF